MEGNVAAATIEVVALRKFIPRLIAIDMDGTLLGEDGRVSTRNLAALQAARAAGVEIVIATGRRHSYALRVLRSLGLHHGTALVSSNGAVTRTLGGFAPQSEPVATELMARAHLPHATARWLCAHLEEFRNALVLTFDRVGADGEDTRGALVVEHLEELHSSIGKWMAANEPYIAQVNPIEDALLPDGEPAIQAMLCGSIERMARAEARLLEHPHISASGHPSGRSGSSIAPSLASSETAGWRADVVGTAPQHHLTLQRTEYPARDLSILDILPAGCSKGAAILSVAAARNIDPAQILAIGDNWNDVSMLEIAGAAVLMDNAPDDLKALARDRGWYIGASHHHDGVAEAIESALELSRETVPC
jgi:hydroxymethylpyrimidine pyrophosphatase-like HAD family hydrolase